MKIEVGKEYIDGHGTIVKILSFVYGAMRYRFKGDNGEIYDVEGNSNPDDPMAHLVSETPPPPPPPFPPPPPSQNTFPPTKNFF